MKNSADLGGCYPPWPSASVDNTLLDLQNSSYPMKAEFNNCLKYQYFTDIPRQILKTMTIFHVVWQTNTKCFVKRGSTPMSNPYSFIYHNYFLKEKVSHFCIPGAPFKRRYSFCIYKNIVTAVT